MKRLAGPAALLLALAAAGCASGGANGSVAQLAVGRATRPDVLDKVPRILDQQGYQVQERRDTGNLIQYMTSWVTREPFDDEASRGATECRTRLTFEGRQQAGDTYAVALRAESMMRRQTMDEEWVTLAPTPMFRAHLREVADALALEIDMGVRTR